MLLNRPLLWATVLSLLLLATAVFSVDLAEALWIFSELVPLALGVLTLVVAGIFMLHAVRRPRRVRHLLSGTLLLGTAFLSLRCGDLLGTRGRFFLLLPYYEHRLELARSGSDDESVMIDGRLIAFPWYRGVTDNWIGLVYDPEDRLDRSYSKAMLGGDLIGVSRVHRNWFLCVFT